MSGSGNCFGGAINVNNNFLLQYSTCTGNTVTYSGTAGTAIGGAVQAYNAVVVLDSAICGNSVALSNVQSTGIVSVVKLIVEHDCLLTSDLSENAFGGAIGSDGSVTLTSGVFRNNSAVVAGSGLAQGGGVFAKLLVQANDTLFDSNSVTASNNGFAGTIVLSYHSTFATVVS